MMLLRVYSLRSCCLLSSGLVSLAIGLGGTELYIFVGMATALFLSLRFFLFKGAGKAN